MIPVLLSRIQLIPLATKATKGSMASDRTVVDDMAFIDTTVDRSFMSSSSKSGTSRREFRRINPPTGRNELCQ